MAQNRRNRKPRPSTTRSGDPPDIPRVTGDFGTPSREDPTYPPGKRDSARAPHDAQSGTRNLIKQAERDISRGLRDTDLHGVPSNVPGPGPDPEQTPGASVPPGGVDIHEGKR